MKKFFTSRKFVVAILYGLGMTAAMLFDLKWSPEAILGMAGVAASYIGAEAMVDAKRTN